MYILKPFTALTCVLQVSEDMVLVVCEAVVVTALVGKMEVVVHTPRNPNHVILQVSAHKTV